MTQQFNHITHHLSKAPDSSEFVISKITPIIRLGQLDGVIYIQSGRFLTEGGEEVKVLPAWVYEEVAKLTPHALMEVGLKEIPVPTQEARVVAQEPIAVRETAAETWQCTDCGKVVAMHGKDAHIAAHNRKRTPETAMKA